MIAYDFAFIATGIANFYATGQALLSANRGYTENPTRFATRETGEMPRYYQLL